MPSRFQEGSTKNICSSQQVQLCRLPSKQTICVLCSQQSMFQYKPFISFNKTLNQLHVVYNTRFTTPVKEDKQLYSNAIKVTLTLYNHLISVFRNKFGFFIIVWCMPSRFQEGSSIMYGLSLWAQSSH